MAARNGIPENMIKEKVKDDGYAIDKHVGMLTSKMWVTKTIIYICVEWCHLLGSCSTVQSSVLNCIQRLDVARPYVWLANTREWLTRCFRATHQQKTRVFTTLSTDDRCFLYNSIHT